MISLLEMLADVTAFSTKNEVKLSINISFKQHIEKY